MTTTATRSLRRILFFDAATCVASGVLMTAAASPLAHVFHLPAGLLQGAGLALFPIAAFIAFVGARATTSLPAVAMVVAGNLAWAAAAVEVIVGGTFTPSVWGSAFAIVQALTVLGLSVLELRGALALRNQTSRAPAHA
ncbi:MAG: hypothetical protein IAG13_12510 [Deltaproteobacteria bacterium]|nr:hypothetical protein [Nannocystaceae bacterium]